MSIEKINNEDITYSQIRVRARKYYGNWCNALKNNGVTPYGSGYFSKEETIKELKRSKEQGCRMRLKDFPPKLVKSIQKHYGGYKNAKIVIGIAVKGEYSKPEAAIKANIKYSEDILATELRKAVEVSRTVDEVNEHK